MWVWRRCPWSRAKQIPWQSLACRSRCSQYCKTLSVLILRLVDFCSAQAALRKTCKSLGSERPLNYADTLFPDTLLVLPINPGSKGGSKMIAIGGHWRSVAQPGAARRSPTQGLSVDVRFLEVALNLLRRSWYSKPTVIPEHALPC